MVLEGRYLLGYGFSLVVGDGKDVAEAATGRESASVWVADGIDDCAFGLEDCVSRIDFGRSNIGQVGATVII
jgi:hypothetical protein